MAEAAASTPSPRCMWDFLHPLQPGARAFQAEGDWLAVDSAQPLCGPGREWASHVTCWLMTQAAYAEPPPRDSEDDDQWIRSAVQGSSFAWQLWRLSQLIEDLRGANAGGVQRKYRLNESQKLGLSLVPPENAQPWTFQQHYSYALESMVSQSVRVWLTDVDGRLTSSEFHGERTLGNELAGSYAVAREQLCKRLVSALLTKPEHALRRGSTEFRLLKQDLESHLAADTARVVERLRNDSQRLRSAVLAVDRSNALVAGHQSNSDPASRVNHIWRAMWLQEHMASLKLLCDEKPALLEEEEEVKVVMRLLEVYLKSNPHSVVENILRALLDNTRALREGFVRAAAATDALREAISHGDVRASGLQISLSHVDSARIPAPDHTGAAMWCLISTRGRYPSREARLNTVVRELLGSHLLPVGVVSCECALAALEIAANELRGQVRRLLGDVEPPTPRLDMRKRRRQLTHGLALSEPAPRRVKNQPLDALMCQRGPHQSPPQSDCASQDVEPADVEELLMAAPPAPTQAGHAFGSASEAARSEVRPASTITSVTSVPSRVAVREDRSACSRLSDYKLQPAKLTLLDRNLLEHLISYLEQRGEGYFEATYKGHRSVMTVDWDNVLQSLTGSQDRFLYEMHPGGIKGARNTIRRFDAHFEPPAPGFFEWYAYKKNRNTPRVLRLQLCARAWLVEQLRALIQRLATMDFVQAKNWVGHRASEVLDTLAAAAQW